MSSTNRGEGRDELDRYPTPLWATHRFLERAHLPGGIWLEPCAGEGAIIQAVADKRNDVIWLANELDPQYEAELRAFGPADVRIGDARTIPLDFDPAVIITNPPFVCAQELLEIFLRHRKSIVVFLQRLDWCAGPRANLFRQLKPSLFVIPERPSFKDVIWFCEKTQKWKKSTTDSCSYAWFVFDGLGRIEVLDATPDDVRRVEKERRRKKDLDRKNGRVVEAQHVIANGDESFSENERENSGQLTVIENTGEIKLSNLPADMREEVAKARVSGGGSYIGYGTYVIMNTKWVFQKIQDRCIIFNGLVVEARKKIVQEGAKTVDQEPNAFSSEVSSVANFDGDAKLSAPGTARAPLLGLFDYKEGEVQDKIISDTLDEVLDTAKQPAAGMLMSCDTFPKGIRSRPGDFICGLNWGCVSKPGEGVNAKHLVDARLAALKTGGAEAAAKLAAEHLAQYRTGAGIATPAPQAAPVAPPPPAPAPPVNAKPWLDGWTPNPNAPGYFYRFVNGAPEQKTEAELQAAPRA